MKADSNKIIAEFNRIKDLGFIKSNRVNTNSGSIGNTFEDYLGVKENNLRDPDFEGFEVKSQRKFAGSKVSLFTKSPTNPKNANSYLKETFGRGDSKFPTLKALHASVFGNRWSLVYNAYKMKMVVNRECERVELLITSINDEILSDNVYWSFEDLKSALNKMSSLFVVVASHRKEGDIEYFHYNSATVYHNLDFDKFLKVLEDGFIMFDIRIGVFKTGKYIGKPHDHGSGFRLNRDIISQLYEEVIVI